MLLEGGGRKPIALGGLEEDAKLANAVEIPGPTTESSVRQQKPQA
jgi:hypothetical protein